MITAMMWSRVLSRPVAIGCNTGFVCGWRADDDPWSSVNCEEFFSFAGQVEVGCLK